MKILFLNNSGGGFADYVEAEEGTSIETFLTRHVHGYKPGDLLIRVNRQPVAKDYALQDGDRVSATPVKIEGAKHMASQVVRRKPRITHHQYMLHTYMCMCRMTA